MLTKHNPKRSEKLKNGVLDPQSGGSLASKATKNMPLTPENPPATPQNTPANSKNDVSVAPEERSGINWSVNPATGKPDFSRMRPVIKERLKGLMSDPDTLRALGMDKAPEVSSGKAPAPVQVFDPSWCGSLYSAVGFLESVFAQKFFQLDPETAKKIFTYTPEEIEKLTGPTSTVLNKYAADWMITFKDEIALGMLFFSITAGKLIAAKMLSQMQIHAVPSAPAHPRPNGKEVPVAPPAGNTASAERAA